MAYGLPGVNILHRKQAGPEQGRLEPSSATIRRGDHHELAGAPQERDAISARTNLCSPGLGGGCSGRSYGGYAKTLSGTDY